MRVEVWGFGFRIWGSGFRVQGLGFKVQSFGIREDDVAARKRLPVAHDVEVREELEVLGRAQHVHGLHA